MKSQQLVWSDSLCKRESYVEGLYWRKCLKVYKSLIATHFLQFVLLLLFLLLEILNRIWNVCGSSFNAKTETENDLKFCWQIGYAIDMTQKKILFEYLYKRTYVSMYVSNTLQTNMLVSKCMQLRTYFYHFSCISSVLRMYLCERFLCFVSVLSTFFFQNEWLTEWMNERIRNIFLLFLSCFVFIFYFFVFITHVWLFVCLSASVYLRCIVV